MEDRMVRHQFELELLAWSDTHYGGQTSKFRIYREHDGMEHPFKQFTRRRSNRVGTRFHAVFVRIGQDHPAFEGDLMLSDWGESKATSEYVSFWHDDDEPMHPFKGERYADKATGGQRYMAVLVEVDDDESTVDHRAQHQAPTRPMSVTQYAALLCKDQAFWRYLKTIDADADWNEDSAARYVRAACGVRSRAELAHDSRAARRFHELVRRPYMEFLDG